MEDYTDPATTWLADWDVWIWVLMIGLLVAAVAWALALPWISDLWGSVNSRPGRIVGGIVLVVGTLAAAVGMVILPGLYMRRIEHHELVWAVAAPLAVVAIAFAIYGYMGAGWRAYAPAALLAVGTAFGAANDAITRAAAAVPISVAGLLLVVGIAVAFIAAKARE